MVGAVSGAADHCTLWPDRLAGMDWSACCLAHDVAYALGRDRAVADLELYRCVAEATGAHWFAGVMFAGVSIFGWAFWKKRRRHDGR